VQSFREWMKRRRERRAVRRELRTERKGKFNSDAMPREAMRGDNMGGNIGSDG
jgi:hypothetical protein